MQYAVQYALLLKTPPQAQTLTTAISNAKYYGILLLVHDYISVLLHGRIIRTDFKLYWYWNSLVGMVECTGVLAIGVPVDRYRSFRIRTNNCIDAVVMSVNTFRRGLCVVSLS